jgi:hypothetical protein
MSRLKRVARDDFQLATKRDHAAEQRSAQISLFSDMERLIDQKQAGDIAVWQVALCLILCGLPYDETPEPSVTRRARLADGSWLTVRFTATGERLECNKKGEPILDPASGKPKVTSIPLPFGADRGPLHFLINKAVLKAKDLERRGFDVSEARFVEWEKANEYLKEMCLDKGGKNYRDLRPRIERIKYCAITVTRTNHGTEETLMAPVLSRTRLPRSLDASYKAALPSKDVAVIEKRPASKQADVMGVEFSGDFFDEFLRNHMPVPVELLRATMGRSQLQDYVLWLYWRAFAAQKDTLIPWRAVREQLWQNDSNEARLYSRMKRAMATLRAVWPELRAEVNPKHFESKGLLIGPPRNGVYVLDGVEAARKQITSHSPQRKTLSKP